MTYRAAVVGCGGIGSMYSEDPLARDVRSHAAAYVDCAETELVALCDTDAARLDRAGERWSVRARYRDVEELLSRERPELVSICTPDATHAAVARAALASPSVRAILVEKPIATDIRDAEDLVRRAHERGVALSVNYSRRFAPGWAALRRLVAVGGIGEVRHVAGRYSGGLLHNGSHWIDLALALAGDIAQVRARPRADRGDDGLDLEISFSSGAHGSLACLDARAYSAFDIDVAASRGRIRSSEPSPEADVFEAAPSPRYSGFRELVKGSTVDLGLHDLVLRAVEDLVASIEGARPPLCTGNDGVAALRAVIAARSSALDGRWHAPGAE